MSLSSWASKIANGRRAHAMGYDPRGKVLQSDIPNDATVSVDRLDPEVFGPLFLRQHSEMTRSANDAEIVSKEYVDTFSAGIGRLNESLRQPYQVGRWYSSSHGNKRQAATWTDGDCRMSAIYVGITASITIDALRLEVTSSVGGGTATPGLYQLAQNTLLPTALLATGPNVSTAAVAKVTSTLTTPLVVTGPVWLGLAVLVNGGPVDLSVDKSEVSCAMQVPYGWTALPFTTRTNAKYALLLTLVSPGGLPAASQFTTASTSNFGSGLWLRRSV